MTDRPKIDSELRSLLEEIVADPHSSIRLLPRKALASWFDTGEAMRARDVSGTVLERHLVEAHREALAKLLCEAGWIAYWKAPGFCFRPLSETGLPADHARVEELWVSRAGRRELSSNDESSGITLLRACLEGIRPELGLPLAEAALGLVPSDRTRFLLALSLPPNRRRTSIALLSRLSAWVQPKILKPDVLASLGSRLNAISRPHEALEAYREASSLVPDSPIDRCSILNITCVLGDAEQAVIEAAQFEGLAPDEPRILEARELICAWLGSRPHQEKSRARDVARRIAGRVPPAVEALCEAYAHEIDIH